MASRRSPNAASSRAFLEPSRIALYRSPEIMFFSRDFTRDGVNLLVNEVDFDFDVREGDLVDNNAADLVLSFLVHPHLSDLVRLLEVD